MPGPYQCSTCPRSFRSPNALIHHEAIHLPLKYACYGCKRLFTTYHGMIIHLEAGNCQSGIDMSMLNRTAVRCYQAKKYTDELLRNTLLNGDVSYRHDPTIWPFRCPTCEHGFPKLSSLFNHIWSLSCEQTMNGGAIGKLRRWMKRSLKGWQGHSA